jgi:glycosyltransferase involved in cell wall biosynthesis
MKRNILFIIPWLPYPMVSGGHQALYNGILAIKNDFNVFVVYEKQTGNDEAENHFHDFFPNVVLLPFSSYKMPLHERIAFWAHVLIRKLFREKITDEERMCNRWVKTISPHKKELVMHIDKVCHKYNFDIIQVEMPWFISLVLSLPKHSKKIFVHHELGFVCRNLEKEKQSENVYVDAFKSFADLNEIGLLNLYDRIITLSSIDSEKLREKGVVAPISTSFAILKSDIAAKTSLCEGNILTFVGPDSHLPNVEGLTWFCDNCWGKLRVQNPNVKLRIIGKWNKSHMQQFCDKYPGVEFMGFVDDLNASLLGSIMIVPITIGSGIRMKILEACSLGIPFVSTSVGAEGIPVINGEHCYLADTPDEFVDGIVNLQNPEIQEKFIKNSKLMIQENYSVDALRYNRLSIYNNL